MKRLLAGSEANSSTTRLWKRIIARCVCATARFSSLRASGTIASFLLVLRGRSKPCLSGNSPSFAVLPILNLRPSSSKNFSDFGSLGPAP